MEINGLVAAFAFLIAIVAVGGFFYLFFYGLWLIVTRLLSGGESLIYKKSGSDTLIEKILLSHSAYYLKLPVSIRPAFVFRVKEFMKSKDFTGREGIVITDEMRVLISASAIQITFGLVKFMFDSFHTIIVYPKIYFSRLNKRYHKGEVNLAGSIVFSWEDFKEGYKIADDNYNLGLHEMAHALRFDKFRNPDFDEFFNEYFNKWQSVSSDEFYRIKAGKTSMIREYAGANKEEFFSVCVEYFFESPQKMKRTLPELYRHMCILLNQDPLGKMDPENSPRKYFFSAVPVNPGRLLFTSPLSYSPAIRPFLIVFAGISFLFISYISNNGADWVSVSMFSIFIVPYVVIGGFTLSRRFRKFRVYENGISIEYSLNPALKNEFYSYDNIISLTLREESAFAEGTNQMSDTMEIVYTDGIAIQQGVFSIGENVSINNMEQVAAYLKHKKVLIKIFGKKWSHKSIGAIEKELRFEDDIV